MPDPTRARRRCFVCGQQCTTAVGICARTEQCKRRQAERIGATAGATLSKASEALPWRAGTRKYELAMAMHDSHFRRPEFRVYMAILWDNPANSSHIARLCFMEHRAIMRALSHLEEHGWLLSNSGRWALTIGSDCGCPERVPRKHRPPCIDPLSAPEGHTALYRLYGDGGRLLYVGITDKLCERMWAHRREAGWWPEVTRKTVAWYPTRAKADQAETLAIAVEAPAHNRDKLYAPKKAVEFDTVPPPDESARLGFGRVEFSEPVDDELHDEGVDRDAPVEREFAQPLMQVGR